MVTPRRAMSVAWLTGLLLPGVAATDFHAQAPTANARVLYDEAHNNHFAAASSGYQPFVQALEESGFTVSRNTVPLGAQRLAMANVLTIVNPTGASASAPVEQRAQPA